MVDFGLFEEVPGGQTKAAMVLSATWVTARKPDGTVRSRFVAWEFLHGRKRDDSFAPSTTSITVRRAIVILVAKGRRHTLTGDISYAFFSCRRGRGGLLPATR